MPGSVLQPSTTALEQLTHSNAQLRSQFIAQVLGIVKDSTGATPLLWVPNGTDTTTSTTDDENQATITHTGGSLASRRSPLGLGYSISFDGSTQYSTVPDAARFTHGDGTTDTAFSILALVKVTNTAAARTIMSKWLASNHEYRFYVSSTDLLDLGLEDESAGVEVHVPSNAAVNQGAWALLGATYDATGGATAANGILQYQNGVAFALGAAVNNASYVGMEDKTAALAIGSANPSAASLSFQGSMAGVLQVGKKLTAGDMWQLYQAFLGYYNFLA